MDADPYQQDPNAWHKEQTDRMNYALQGSDQDVEEQEFHAGSLSGVWYKPKASRPVRALVIIHGMFGNKYSCQVFAKRLARYQFFVVTLDLPSHYKNTDKLTVGAVADQIHAGVKWTQQQGFAQVAVMGHSMGAIGAIFASAGYTSQVEQSIYGIWDKMQNIIGALESLEEKRAVHQQVFAAEQKLQQAQSKDFSQSKFLNAQQNLEKIITEIQAQIQNVETEYQQLRQVIYRAIETNISNSVNAYVLLAPPLSAKGFFPGLPVLKRTPKFIIKFLIGNFMHKGSIKRVMKEGNQINYQEDWEEKDAIMWQNFKVKDAHEFLEYMINLKEPSDYISLIKSVKQFKHKDKITTFFDYYYTKYIMGRQKYFIYGKRDILLKAYIPLTNISWKKKDLLRFYNEVGATRVEEMDVNHIFTEEKNDHTAILGGTSQELAIKVIQFLVQQNWR